MENMWFYCVVAAIVIAAVVVGAIRKKKNMGKVDNGEDIGRIRQEVAKVLPDEAGYRVLYAHWEESNYRGRRTTTYYYHYAVAYDDSRMWVIPMKYEKKQIILNKPILMTAENTGSITVNPFMKKGELWEVDVTFLDKEGKSPLYVNANVLNLQSDGFHHFNIAQKAECESFLSFIRALAEQVNEKEENKAMQQKKEDSDLKRTAKGSLVFGILGIVFSFIPVVGLMFGGIGLLVAPKPSKSGGKKYPGFILSAIALAVDILVPAIQIIVLANSVKQK